MKRFLSGLLFLFIAGFLFANPVEKQTAQKVATNAYFQKVNQYFKAIDFSDLLVTDQYEIKRDGYTVLYIFNFSNLGYIIVSADDALNPVQAYSFESQYNPVNEPDNFKGWLNGRTGAVKYAMDNHLAASKEIGDLWQEYTTSQNLSLKAGGKSIEPLLTCTWNQNWPYNYYCPEDAGGSQNHTYVGCVATAMSQIMLYWRYPNQGSGSHSYVPEYHPQYGQQTANFGATYYNWEGMLDNSDSKINLPMALVGYHAAVSVDMDFGPDGSGAFSADVPYAMRTYFNYDISIQYLSFNTGMQWATWKSYIEGELDLLRPVYYSGRDAQYGGSGHAFVLDGYHPDGTYHFNFGWSGQENGWFDITSPSGYEWYYHQGLVRRIFPGDASYPYGCDQSGENTNLVGSIEDGSGPCTNYIDNANCQWLINPQNEYDSVSTIRLSFVALDTDPDDIITLFDGESTSAPVIGTFSGTTLPSGFFYSTGNKMLITLEGDGDDVTGCGFRAEYMSNQPTWCSSSLTTYTDPMGSFDDGSGTWYYKNQSNCMWKILPQYAMGVTLTFTEFDTEEGSDFLKIYDASNNQLLATYSGHYTAGNMPDPIYTASGQLFLIWQTDGAVNAPGWSADWETGNVSVQENIEGLSNVKIYPNPAESFVNVSFRADTYQTFSIRVISTDGHIVYTEKTQNFLGNYINSINLSGFAKGVYFLSLVSDRGNLNRKLIVK